MKFIFDSYSLVNNEKENQLFFDGVLISNENIYVSKNSRPADIEIKEGSGQFVVINSYSIDKNNYLEIFTDFMGFYEIFYFYCEKDKRLIISNNFRVLADYYRKQIGSLSIDTDYVIPLLLSNYNFFNLPFSNRTAAIQIKRIPANKNIYFNDNEGISFIDKMSKNDLEKVNYENALDMGVSSIRSKILMLDKFDMEKTLYMSGGKDSRVTLSTLMYTLSNKSFNVFSQDPNRFFGKSRETIREDLIITNKLCMLFSLNKVSKDYLLSSNKEYDLNLKLNFEESYNQWMDEFSNIKYKCKFANHKRIEKNNFSTIEYHGLAGEVYRNYWSSYFQRFLSFDRKLEKSHKSCKKDLQKFFYTFVKTKIVDRELYENAKRALINEFYFINGENIYEKLDTHYGEFRNKYHFGAMLNSLKSGVLLFSPLVDYNYLLASKVQNRNDKENGKLLYDIIDKTNPYLNLIPFDSSVWSNKLKSRSVIDKEIINLPSFSEINSLNFKVSNTETHENSMKNKDEDVEIPYNFDYIKCAKQKINDYIQFLTRNNDSEKVFNKDLELFFLNSIEKDDIYVATILGKLGSIMDIYNEVDVSYEINPFI